MEKARTITQIALLAALITITGAIKLPSIFPGMEFQLSAPLAVSICAVFGFKKYIIAGLISSSIGLMLGTQNLFHVAVQMQFRIVVGIVLLILGRHLWSIAISGPLGTLVARLTLSLVLGKAAYALVAAAVPGMLFTLVTAPFLTKVLTRVEKITATAAE